MVFNNFACLVSMPELEAFFRTVLYPKKLVGIECVQKGKTENVGKIIVKEKRRFEIIPKRIKYFFSYNDLQMVIATKEMVVLQYSLEENTDWICYLLNLDQNWKKGYKEQIRRVMLELKSRGEKPGNREIYDIQFEQLTRLLLGET